MIIELGIDILVKDCFRCQRQCCEDHIVASDIVIIIYSLS